jgi:hypothetical protein
MRAKALSRQARHDWNELPPEVRATVSKDRMYHLLKAAWKRRKETLWLS